MKAEIDLAKAELGLRMRNSAIGMGWAVVGFLTLIPAMVILESAEVVALTRYLGGAGMAGPTVSIVLLATVVVLGLIAKYLFVKRPGK